MFKRLKYFLFNIYKIHKIKKIFMFWIYYPYLARYVPKKDIFAQNENGKYILPRSYASARSSRIFLCGEIYEKETIDFIKDNYKNTGSIIHAGCSWGDHLPVLSKIVRKNFNIYAFEPNNLSFSYANKNKQINNLDNVSIKNCALGDEKSFNFINITDKKKNILAGTSIITAEGTIENRWKSNWQTFLFNALKIKPEIISNSAISNSNIKKQKIKIETLDSQIPLKEKISIIFLDVELYEEKVLRGAKKILENHKPILILEYFNNDKFEKSIIKKIGYRFKNKCNNNYIYFCSDLN